MKKNNRVVVTGIGPLTAAGSGKKEVWSSVLAKRTGLVRKLYDLDGEKLGEFYVHSISSFDIGAYGLDKRLLDEIRNWKAGDQIVDLYYFLATIKMALDDSGLKIGKDRENAVGIVLAHENIGLDHFYWKVVGQMCPDAAKGSDVGNKRAFFDRFYDKFKRTGYELQSFMPLYHVAKTFGIHGYSLFINNACASGLYAIEAAADAIRSGKCTHMVAGAVDRSSIFKHVWFDELKMFAKDGRIKPFALGRDGFTLGDGGAAIVLESMESAKKRKAHIYAEYVGGSFALEGWKVTYPDITSDRYEVMIRRAIKASGMSKSQIDLIVPHGIGTSVTDEYEARAIAKIFGPKKDRPYITALKPYTGHTLGSSAMLETAIMLMVMDSGTIPGTLNCENEDGKLPVNILRKTVKDTETRVALKTACGFAGFDGACVFKVAESR